MIDPLTAFGGGLITEDEQDQMEPRVATLAETLHEHGWPPENALDTAWSVALLPKLMDRLEEDW